MKQNNKLQNYLLSNFCNLISVRLDNSNYVTWKFLLETMLKGCGLLRYVDGSFPCPPRHMIGEEDEVTSEMTKQYMKWQQNDSAIMSILSATLSSDVLSFVVGSKTSRELWCLLKERYASTSRSNRMHLKTNFQNLQKGSDSIDQYLLRVKIACDQLANVGVQLPDEDIIVTVLHGLPSKFATMKAIIRTKKSLVSLQELRSLLLIAEDEIELATKSTYLPSNLAMAAYSDPPRGTIPSHLFTDSSLPSIGTVLVPPTTVCPNVGTSSNATGYNHALINLNGRDKNNGVFGHGNFTPRGEQRDMFNSNGCTDFCNGVQHKKNTFHNQVPQAGCNSNSQSVCFPGDVCRICSQFGHIAETCPQRSAPRHLYSLQPKTLAASPKVNFSHESQISEFCVSEASAQEFEENSKLGFAKESIVSDLVDKKRKDYVGSDLVDKKREDSVGSDLVDKKRADSIGSEVSLPAFQKFIQETKSVDEADCKEGFTASLSTVLGKETESANFFDVKKKQLLGEVAEKKVHDTTKIDEKRIGYPGLQSGTNLAALQLSIPTLPAPFISESPSMISTASFGISNHKSSLYATQVSYNLSEWQPVMLKEIEALLPQSSWQLPSAPPDSTSLHCRQASHPMELCQSLPLINPG